MTKETLTNLYVDRIKQSNFTAEEITAFIEKLPEWIREDVQRKLDESR